MAIPRHIFQNYTMAELADFLMGLVSGERLNYVLDKTNLTGRYDFKLKFEGDARTAIVGLGVQAALGTRDAPEPGSNLPDLFKADSTAAWAKAGKGKGHLAGHDRDRSYGKNAGRQLVPGELQAGAAEETVRTDFWRSPRKPSPGPGTVPCLAEDKAGSIHMLVTDNRPPRWPGVSPRDKVTWDPSRVFEYLARLRKSLI